MKRFHWLALTALAGCSSSPIRVGETNLSPALLTGGTYHLQGIVDDKLLVLAQDSARAIFTVPVAGGAAATVIANGDEAEVLGSTVLIKTALDTSMIRESFSTWNDSDGETPLAASSATAQFLLPRVSGDGQWIVYFDNVSKDGTTGDLIVSKLDGSGRQTIASAIPSQVDAFDCLATASAAGGAFVVSFCRTFDSVASTYTAELHFVSPASGTNQLLFTSSNFMPYALSNPTHDLVVAIDLGGQGQLIAPDGTMTQFAADASQFAFAPDGNVLYLTSDGQLARYDVAKKTTLTLQTLSGSDPSIFDVSPDGAHIMVSQSENDNFEGMDLYVASTTSVAPLLTVQSMTTAEPGFDDGGSFSGDSAWAFYLDPIDANFRGSLLAMAVGGGTGAQLAAQVVNVFNTHGSKAVLCANFDGWASCDLVAVDAADPGVTSTVARGIVAYEIHLLSDKSRVFYSIDNDGVYSAPLP